MVDVDEKIVRSRDAFLAGAWEPVSKAIGGGSIVPVEGERNKEFLDQYSGIDHWHVNDSEGTVRGLACRCQWTWKRFYTFTVRIGNKAVDKTELAKRIYAMEHADKGWIRPHYIVQAYFGGQKWTGEKFLYAGVARMDDILKIIRDGKEGEDWRQQVTAERWGNNDSSRFAIVDFDAVTRLGYPFRLVEG